MCAACIVAWQARGQLRCSDLITDTLKLINLSYMLFNFPSACHSASQGFRGC